MARLELGRPFPVAIAVNEGTTDLSRVWRDNVIALCQLIGYVLPEDDWDEKGRPGSFFLCHAEKKLVAYYLNQYVILPVVPFEGLEINQLGEWMKQDAELQDLATLCPKVPAVRANIRVSRPVCHESGLFIAHVEIVLGVSFTVESY
jgi:hypothetical protein